MPEKKRYTRDLLTEAAANSTDLVDMMHRLGTPPTSEQQYYLKRRLNHYGIDTSHFVPRGGLLPADELADAVARSRSIAGVLAALGMKDNGSSRRRIAADMSAHGIRADHFTGQGHNHGRPSPRRKSADEILTRRPSGSHREKHALLRRALDERGVERRCAQCGLGESWQGKRLVHEIDHIDGNRLNNTQGNLRYLCPSCHSQTRSHSIPQRSAAASWRDEDTSQ
ncbi:HNH endonuclease signature motif containing protein [Streptomyces sp. SCUT-3]|uniref:HNH endonuclease signature motif containing protein n=1 Tax=Streptomyces sp. SCUT-3 TaxID=2684469 RepID=UPI0021751BB3|nr:HNH endonuclease signature motif containing protein [Streptomyces sp. SCUT-3]